MLQQILQQFGPQAVEAYGQFLQPYNPEQFQELFDQAFIKPAMMTYEQNTLPAIYESFGDANAGSSSALNQALAASAKDLSTGLGSQMGQFYQNYMGNQMSALSGLMNPMGQPIVRNAYSPYGDAISGAAKIGASALPYVLSTMQSKENVRPCKLGLDSLRTWDVYQFDYKKCFGGQRDVIGMIAEDLPNELIDIKEGLAHVNLYSVIGVLVNSIQELADRIESLEAQHGNSGR